MGSFATVTPTSMELTPMRVKYDGIDLGGTLGNVVINAKYLKSPIKADQFGQSIIDRRVSGIEITVTTELAEIQNKDTVAIVFPHATIVGSGPKKIQFKENIGDSDLAHANELLLHPLSLDNADLSGDYKFLKAVASAESSITYGPTEQARWKIVWNILPDTSTSPAIYCVIGDPSIV